MPTQKKIVIVDDDVELTAALGTFLRNAGYQIDICNSSEDAYDSLEGRRPDLVLLDLKMPGIDGFHIARRVKETRPSVKLIVISGYADEYKNELAKIKVEAVIQKPVAINFLESKIQELVGLPITVVSTGKEVTSGIPKAKLLFIESNDIVYTYLFGPYFREMNGSKKAEYELLLADDKDNALMLTRLAVPDIVLLNTNVIKWYPDILKEIEETVQGPKELIVHGRDLYLKSPGEIGLNPDKVTSVEGGMDYNLDYPRRLEKTVREIAYRYGLVVR